MLQIRLNCQAFKPSAHIIFTGEIPRHTVVMQCNKSAHAGVGCNSRSGQCEQEQADSTDGGQGSQRRRGHQLD